MAKDSKQSALYDSNRFTSWKVLLDELFQSDLVAPTSVDPKDVQFSRRMTVYRLMLMLMLVSVGILLVESLALGASSSAFLLSCIVGELALAATLFWLSTHHRILLPPVISLATTIGLVLWIIALGSEHHALWLFPLMIAMAGLLPTSVALILGVATLAALIGVRGVETDANDLAEDAALVATWMISLAVMRLMTRQTDELADLALTDPLTGAYNRRYLMPQANRNLADYRRYARLSCLLMIDIDHFKQVNDTLGHGEGDRVLKDLVQLIDNRIRGVDMLFRLGGEEFVVLLSEVGAKTAMKIAEELRVAVSRMDTLGDRTVTVSIGLCDVSQVESAEDWLHKVDEAMYLAKQRGRDQVCMAVPKAGTYKTITETMPVWR